MFLRAEEISHKKVIPVAQVAVAWCLAKDGVMVPVIGTTQVEDLKEVIGQNTI